MQAAPNDAACTGSLRGVPRLRVGIHDCESSMHSGQRDRTRILSVSDVGKIGARQRLLAEAMLHLPKAPPPAPPAMNRARMRGTCRSAMPTRSAIARSDIPSAPSKAIRARRASTEFTHASTDEACTRKIHLSTCGALTSFLRAPTGLGRGFLGSLRRCLFSALLCASRAAAC